MPTNIPSEMGSYLIPWPLDRKREEKRYLETTHRACPPEETFEKLKPLRESAGITRLADITHLDCLGIPTYMAVRPRVDHYTENISVYNGKGMPNRWRKSPSRHQRSI